METPLLTRLGQGCLFLFLGAGLALLGSGLLGAAGQGGWHLLLIVPGLLLLAPLLVWPRLLPEVLARGPGRWEVTGAECGVPIPGETFRTRLSVRTRSAGSPPPERLEANVVLRTGETSFRQWGDARRVPGGYEVTVRLPRTFPRAPEGEAETWTLELRGPGMAREVLFQTPLATPPPTVPRPLLHRPTPAEATAALLDGSELRLLARAYGRPGTDLRPDDFLYEERRAALPVTLDELTRAAVQSGWVGQQLGRAWGGPFLEARPGGGYAVAAGEERGHVSWLGTAPTLEAAARLLLAHLYPWLPGRRAEETRHLLSGFPVRLSPMTPDLQDVLTTATEANSRVNDVLCAQLTPEMMRAVTPGGGLTVAQHLAHMAGVTKFWLSELDAEAAAPLPVLYDTSREDVFVAQEDPARAAQVLREVHSAALQTVLRAGGRGGLSHPSPAQFLLHMHTHDAHHRGQMLLALKTAGFALPDEDAMWGPLRGE